MANILTSIRIICGILILTFPTFSKWYYLLYIIGGITDAIDGTVARKLGKNSNFGAKYDTFADLIFTFSVIISIIKEVYFPVWLLVWICVIFVTKIINIIIGFIKYKKFITVHSIINKICGITVFILPIVLVIKYSWNLKIIVVAIVCLIASISAILESIKVINNKTV